MTVTTTEKQKLAISALFEAIARAYERAQIEHGTRRATDKKVRVD